jgi:hypothetical protein
MTSKFSAEQALRMYRLAKAIGIWMDTKPRPPKLYKRTVKKAVDPRKPLALK